MTADSRVPSYEWLPPRDRTPTPGAVWFGLIGGPAAWALQGLLGWGIAGAACNDGTAAWGPLSPGGVRMLLVVLSLAALGAAVASGVGARQWWRGLTPPGRFTEAVGKQRLEFMAIAGVLVSIVFSIAITWTGLAVLWLDVCEWMR